jgi:cholesterol transport system auxiliary component
MRRRSFARAAIVAFLLSGCSLLSPPRPEPTKALLSKVPDEVPHARRHTASLLILTPEASPAYDTTRMAYTLKPYELAYFRDNEWAETPAQMLEPLLAQTIQRTGFFQAILRSPEVGRASFALRCEIQKLVQDYTVSPPLLRLALHLQLLAGSGQPLGARDIDVQEAMQQATPYAGVVAANNAFARALQETAQFVLDSAH